MESCLPVRLHLPQPGTAQPAVLGAQGALLLDFEVSHSEEETWGQTAEVHTQSSYPRGTFCPEPSLQDGVWGHIACDLEGVGVRLSSSARRQGFSRHWA